MLKEMPEALYLIIRIGRSVTRSMFRCNVMASGYLLAVLVRGRAEE